jgi:hypothetical protein
MASGHSLISSLSAISMSALGISSNASLILGGIDVKGLGYLYECGAASYVSLVLSVLKGFPLAVQAEVLGRLSTMYGAVVACKRYDLGL